MSDNDFKQQKKCTVTLFFLLTRTQIVLGIRYLFNQWISGSTGLHAIAYYISNILIVQNWRSDIKDNWLKSTLSAYITVFSSCCFFLI